ncbi:unnamed protein product [Cercopithifilaria johnstoni]|uniref:Uncharacterized protein n=1 Tax=Cercopithifilaria johnstoni TaxID=2874296 RepID=A0A8J2PTC0_9BILA|nr:unnamed protein product [Cercopithifilaria johnstoni]
MNLCKVLWSRLALGVLSVIFLLLYIAQYKKYRSNFADLSDKCSKLMVHSGGLSAQLQLLMERNHRAEELLVNLRAKYNQVLMETNERYENLEVQWLVCEETLKKCLVGVTTDKKQFNGDKKQFSGGKGTNFQNRLFQCQTEIKEFRNQIEELKEEAKNISIIKNECEKLLINSQVRFMENFV